MNKMMIEHPVALEMKIRLFYLFPQLKITENVKVVCFAITSAASAMNCIDPYI